MISPRSRLNRRRPPLLFALALAGCQPNTFLPDLGSDELRTRVELLKEEILTVPTTAANVFDRNEVLWPWANALGLAGVAIPVDLPLHAALVRWGADDGGEPELPVGLDLPLAFHIRRIDSYIRELALKEDHPGALGRLAFSPDEALVSGDLVTVEESYVLGTAAMPSGGSFLVAKTWVADELRLQHSDPTAPNYVSARSSRADVLLEPVTIPWTGVHGSTRGNQDLPGFRVTGGTLEPGDVVTFTLGDRGQGSPGLRVPTFSVDRFIVPIYVDLDGSGVFLTSDWPELAIVGRPAVAAVRLLAPSVLTPGEVFSLTVRSEDLAMNRSSGDIPAYEVLRDGERVASLSAGKEAVARVDGLSVEAPGVARFEIRSADDRLQAWSNPIWVEEEPRHRIFWGDTHGHTSMAEGQGSARSFFEYAREDARLDFVTLSEHDIWMHDAEWQELQGLTREFTREGSFTAILGYEWSAFRNRGGHHNVFFRRAEGPRVSVHDASRLPALYQGLRRGWEPDDVLIIPHAHEAGDWTRSDADLERLVEVYSMHGSFEWFANRYLRAGFEVGVVAASDDHHAKPGLTPPPLAGGSQPGGLAGVLAAENDTDAIFDALRARAVYATSGQRILLAATVNGYPMGSRQPAGQKREIWSRVSGTAPIERIDVVRNGEVLMSRPYAAAPLTPHVFVQVVFESTSDPLGDEVLNPRGYRNWVGVLEVAGASLKSVRPVGLDHATRESVTIDPESPQEVQLQILTRGRADSILLELDGAGPATALRLRLEASLGTSSISSLLPGDEIPPIDLRIELGELRGSRVEYPLPVDGHADRVSVQFVDPDAPLDQELSYTDLTGSAGDYYYVRITQLDGAHAWSSPFWIGERIPQTSLPGRSSR